MNFRFVFEALTNLFVTMIDESTTVEWIVYNGYSKTLRYIFYKLPKFIIWNTLIYNLDIILFDL